MANTKYMQWRIRAGGVETNGGGFDSSIASAGTDYTEQDAPQLSLSDLATTGVVTTLTSVTGGFTALMIGNVIRIPSGTNFTPGYYTIITYSNTNTVTLDRACTTAAGVSGVGKVGGAWAGFVNVTNGGSGLASPAIATPLAPGHTINWRGNGTAIPTGTVTWDYSAGYWTAPDGDSTSGPVKVIGYNGRPFIGLSPLLVNAAANWRYTNLAPKFLAATYVTNGISGHDDNLNNCHYDHYVDGNGKDVSAIDTTGDVVNCTFVNSGTAGSWPCLHSATYGGVFIGNYIKNWRGAGIWFYSVALTPVAMNNIINGCKAGGIVTQDNGSSPGALICGNTIYNCTGDGIAIPGGTQQHIMSLTMFNNTVSNCSGYGFNSPSGTATPNNNLKHHFMDYNNFYNNTSGAYNNISAGPHDTTLDPTFTNASGDDFSIGTNLKALGFPGALVLGGTSYVDIGALQRQEAGGGSAGIVVNSGLFGGLQ